MISSSLIIIRSFRKTKWTKYKHAKPNDWLTLTENCECKRKKEAATTASEKKLCFEATNANYVYDERNTHNFLLWIIDFSLGL